MRSTIGRLDARAAVVIIGLGIGVGSLLAQASLPTGWSQVGNSGSVWLVGAFAAGSLMLTLRGAALAGLATLLLAVVGYYVSLQLWRGWSGAPSSIVFWLALALVGGPLFGAAGCSWHDPRPWRRATGIGLLGAAFIAEGLHHRWRIAESPVAWAFVGVGLLIPLLLARTRLDRLRASIATAAILPLGIGAYWLIDRVLAVV
jgi:hypothetical protein